MALVSVFGLVQLLILHDLTRLQVVGFGVSLIPIIVLILGLLLGAHYRTKVDTLAEKLASAWARLWKRPFDPAHVHQGIADFFLAWELLQGGKWKLPLLGALINTVFDMGTLFFLFMAAGHSITPAMLLTGYGLPLLLGKAAFILPGGVGVVESSMAALYTSLGVPNATSVVVVLAYRLISFWLPSLLGFPAMFFLQRQVKTSNTP